MLWEGGPEESMERSEGVRGEISEACEGDYGGVCGSRMVRGAIYCEGLE